MPTNILDLTESEERRVSELLVALRTPVSTWINPESWLVSDAFAAEFQSRLLAQHVFMKSVVEQASFDSAFIASSEVAGESVLAAPGGQRFWDVQVGERKISLKSSSALSLRENKLHISKLTEAAWIQDCRTPKMRMERVHGLFRDYVNTVSSIIQLRFFRKTTTYELVEIPTTLLRQVLDLRVADFLAEGTTVNIPVGKIPPDFTLKLDRSDAKITLANIAKDACIVHGTWTIS
jgi:hypothetical protein